MPESNHTAKKFLTPEIILIFLVVVNVLVGGLVVSDFGGGWDDIIEFERGRQAYTFFYDKSADDSIYYPPIVKYYGAAYNMFLFRAITEIQASFPHLHTYVLNHFFNFLVFQLSFLGLYLVASRILGKWYGLLAALLYCYQPVIFGHAFNNPKDTPLMSLFVTTIALGVIMVDRFTQNREVSIFEGSKSQQAFSLGWAGLPQTKRRRLQWFIYSGSALLLLLLIFKWFVNIFLASFMASIYHAPGDTIWGKAFLLVSEQAAAAPLENYQHRLISLFTAFLLAAILLYPLLAGTLLIKNAAKSTRLFSSDFWKLFGGLVLNLNAKLVRLVFNRFFLLALAGVILGFTMSTRFLAGVSAGIVALYFIYKASWKALPPLVVYAALGVVTMYATWPFLWPDLIDRFSEAARVMTRFPDDRDILFAGQVMGSKSLPASYLPTLFSLKFTEPLVIFFVVGIVLLLFKKVWREYVNDRLLLALCLAWFILPFTYFVIAKPNLYDNIRHVIFITPPLAIIAALGIKAFLAKLKTLPLKTGLVLFVFLPSLYSLVNLHPYQYIYFNAFTGGVQGAFRKYELDYWASSYKEAVEFLNDTAEDNARVSVFGPYYIAQLYQRPDLRIDKGDRQPTLEGHDYVIMYTRANWDLYYDVQGEVVYTVNIGDAVLAYVYKLK